MANETDLNYNINGKNNLKKQLQENAKLSDRLSSKLGEVAKIAGGVALGGLVGGGIEGALRGIGQQLGESVTRLREFSRATAEVNSILPANEKLTRGSLEAFKNLAAEYATSPARQAKAFYDIVSAGVEGTAKQLDVLAASNEAATAGLVDVQTAADVTTSVLNAYASEGLTATEVTDSLFTAVRLGKTTFDELSSSVGQATAIASSAGVSLDELSGTLAFITKNGISTAEAVTGIRAVLTAVVKPSEDARKAAEELGIEFNTAAIKSKGFPAFLKSISEATGGSQEALARLFPNVRALGPILQIASKDFSEFQAVIDEFVTKSGATRRAAEDVRNSLDFQLDQAQSKLDSFIDSLSEDFVAAAGAAAGAFNAFTTTDLEDVNDDIADLTRQASALKTRIDETDLDSIGGENRLNVLNAQLDVTLERLRSLNEQRQRLGGQDENFVIARGEATTDEFGLPQDNFVEINQQQIEANAEKNKKLVEQEKSRFEEIAQLADEFRIRQEERQLEDQELSNEDFEEKLQVIQDQLGQEEALRVAANVKKLADEKNLKGAQLALEKTFTKAKVKEEQARLKLEQQTQQQRVNLFSNAGNLINAITGKQTKAGFLLGKAAAIGQVAIADGQARANALAAASSAASAAGPAAPAVFASTLATLNAIITANTALAGATIAASAIQGFNQGGIVGGIAPTSGDNRIIAARSGELILTEAQQDRVANKMMAGGNQDQVVQAIGQLSQALQNQPIVVEIDSQEIARATRDGVRDGVRII